MSKSANGKSISDTDKDAFKNKVNDGRLYGYLLLRLARGRAYELYLENIEPMLAECIRKQLEKQALNLDEDDDSSDSDEEGGGDETINKGNTVKGKAKAIEEELQKLEEIDLIDPFEIDYDVEGKLMKSFVAWLRLMVVHFDACEILVEFVNDKLQFPYDEIAVTMLVAPTSGSQVLPWKELFTTDGFLPTENKSDAFDSVTNTEIMQFLEEGIQRAQSAVSARKYVKIAKIGLKAKRYGRIRSAISKLAELQPRDPLVTSLHTVLLATKGKKSKPDGELDDDIAKEVMKIYKKYRKVPAGSNFFLKLAREDPFGGALHCEIFLATLLDDTHYGVNWPLQQSNIMVSSDFTSLFAKLTSRCVHRVTDV